MTSSNLPNSISGFARPRVYICPIWYFWLQHRYSSLVFHPNRVDCSYNTNTLWVSKTEQYRVGCWHLSPQRSHAGVWTQDSFAAWRQRYCSIMQSSALPYRLPYDTTVSNMEVLLLEITYSKNYIFQSCKSFFFLLKNCETLFVCFETLWSRFSSVKSCYMYQFKQFIVWKNKKWRTCSLFLYETFKKWATE